ncbi:VirB4 family type IV secretion system protein [Ktedonospora formicarum]|uniref:TraG P-loop domain-containing protein n=1 Tax=Ktedonospora formicarum TaxID=2778364 RepID=A0A8J3I3G0_9CHLR|nr:DUF87 domain-containing protein [Ktedonospora formicarum]GHO48599.1 hypothetical protein KSX_67620 [Ktedonospora formicarum]
MRREQHISVPRRVVTRTRKGKQTARRRSASGSVQRDFVRLEAIEQDILCLRPSPASPTGGKDYLAILDIRATNYTLTSADERRGMITAFRALLRALRFRVQILVHARRMDLSDYVAILQQHREEANWSEVASLIVESHEHALALLGSERTLIDRHFYLVVPADEQALTSFDAWTARLSRWLRPGARTRQEQLTLDDAQQTLSTRVGSLTHQLSAMGLQSRRLAGKELADLAHLCLQGETAAHAPLPDALFSLAGRPLARSTNGIPTPSEGPLLTNSAARKGRKQAGHRRSTEALPHEEVSLDERLRLPSARDRLLAPADVIALRDLLAPPSVKVASHQLEVGEEYVRGLVVIGFPREIMEGCLAPLLALDETVDISLHLTPQSNAELLKRLLFRREQYASSQRSSLRRGRHPDPDLQVAESDVEALIGPLASGEESVLELGFYLLVRAPDLRSLEERTRRVRSLLHQLLFVVHPTTLEHADAYRSCQPEGSDTLMRTMTTTSTVAACLFPFISESFSQEDGTFVGVTTGGEPIFLNPWALESPHEFCAGVTGSGKSFGIELRISHEHVRHPETQILILDPSREYVPLIESFGGTIIRLSAGSEACINPFDLLPAGVEMQRYVEQYQGDRLAEKITQLHTCLDLLLADYVPVPTTLSAREKAMLDRAFYECYRRVGITADPCTHDRQAPLMRDLYDVLKSGTVGQDEYGLADRLERYVHGSLSGLFNRATSVSLKTSLIGFDLSEMRGSRELRPIGMFLIADLIWSQARYHARPRRCYIDEAWSLIEHEEGGRFLERLAREARKHYLSLVTITQNPEQFIANPYGSVIAQNALTKVLKRLDAVGVQAAREAFGFTEQEQSLLLSLPQNQALLMVGAKRMLVEMNASPQEHALFTTDPREREALLSQAMRQQAVLRPHRKELFR